MQRCQLTTGVRSTRRQPATPNLTLAFASSLQRRNVYVGLTKNLGLLLWRFGLRFGVLGLDISLALAVDSVNDGLALDFGGTVSGPPSGLRRLWLWLGTTTRLAVGFLGFWLVLAQSARLGQNNWTERCRSTIESSTGLSRVEAIINGTSGKVRCFSME